MPHQGRGFGSITPESEIREDPRNLPYLDRIRRVNEDNRRILEQFRRGHAGSSETLMKVVGAAGPPGAGSKLVAMDEQFASYVKRAGLRLDKPWELGGGKKLYATTDPQHGSTVNFRSDEELTPRRFLDKINERRKTFSDAKGAEYEPLAWPISGESGKGFRSIREPDPDIIRQLQAKQTQGYDPGGTLTSEGPNPAMARWARSARDVNDVLFRAGHSAYTEPTPAIMRSWGLEWTPPGFDKQIRPIMDIKVDKYGP